MKPAYDIAIMGAGLAGSTLALILSRRGLRVLLVDKDAHPRFALGESTIVPASLWLKRLAVRFDLPELDAISDTSRLTQSVGRRCGVKRCFGLVYHRKEGLAAERRWMSLVPPSYRGSTGEAHLFREDVDAHVYRAALANGVEGRVNVIASKVSFEEDRAAIHFASGERAEARCVVDATGYQSVLGAQMGLRDQPTRLRTRSRSIFTHLTGVRSYGDCESETPPVEGWHRGTMHHLTEHAWIWVIPFDNHDGSSNPLCSVGLNLDLEHYPERDDLTPEEEWNDFLSWHPSIAAQFENAIAVRPWTRTKRLQFSSRTTVGDRFMLLGQAAGAVDALYSRGLLNVFQSIDTAATLLLDGCDRDVFTAEHFAPLDRLQQKLLTIHDQLVWGSYQAFHSSDLYHMWLLIWGVSERLSILLPLPALDKSLISGDRSLLERPASEVDVPIAYERVFRLFLDGCVHAMDRLLAGEVDERRTIETLTTELHSMTSVGFDYRMMQHSISHTNFRRAA